MTDDHKPITPKSPVSTTAKQAVAIITTFVLMAWWVRGAIDGNTAELRSIRGDLQQLSKSQMSKANHDTFVWYANEKWKQTGQGFPLPYEAEYLHEDQEQNRENQQPGGDQ